MIEAAGVRFAYRRFRKKEGLSVVFMMHFNRPMDHCDPAVTDGFARDREVILFNNTGISTSSGEVPTSIEEMARYAGSFVNALGLDKIDLLGFSLGGLVAQQLTLDRPDIIRRLILVGTGPRSGEGMATLTPEAQEIFGKKYAIPEELWLGVFFAPTENSQAAGRAFLERFRERKENRDPEVSEKVAPAQVKPLVRWGAAPRETCADVQRLTRPS